MGSGFLRRPWPETCSSHAGGRIQEWSTVGVVRVGTNACAIVSGDAQFRVAHAADSSFSRAHGRLMFRNHCRCISSGAIACRRSAFLSYALRLSKVSACSRFLSPPPPIFSLGHLCPALQSDLIEAFHLLLATLLGVLFGLGHLNDQVNAIAFAFHCQHLFVLTDRSRVRWQRHDRAHACMSVHFRIGRLLRGWRSVCVCRRYILSTASGACSTAHLNRWWIRCVLQARAVPTLGSGHAPGSPCLPPALEELRRDVFRIIVSFAQRSQAQIANQCYENHGHDDDDNLQPRQYCAAVCQPQTPPTMMTTVWVPPLPLCPSGGGTVVLVLAWRTCMR